VKRLWEGRAGNRGAEIADTAAAVTGLINFIIVEHPRLFRLLTNARTVVAVSEWISERRLVGFAQSAHIHLG
jgi:hypothetical protein